MDDKFLRAGTLQPRPQSLLSPHSKGSKGKEDPGSGWSRVFHPEMVPEAIQMIAKNLEFEEVRSLEKMKL